MARFRLLWFRLTHLKVKNFCITTAAVAVAFIFYILFSLAYERIVLPSCYVSMDCTGERMGNLLFCYGSLLGIAARNNRTPIIPHSFTLCDVFDVHTKVGSPFRLFSNNYVEYEEYGRRASAYDINTEHLTIKTQGLILQGYFQSYKYMKNIEHQVKQNLKFKKEIYNHAHSFLTTNIPAKQHKYVKVGIHVRRGDMADTPRLRDYGYTVATADYIHNAMQYFQNKYEDVFFVVCSDDILWCKSNIQSNSNIIFSESFKETVDLAILSLCDHTIITVGSFGWWAAWFANGTTIYYRKWPRPNSILEYMIDKRSYFPPKWIPMS